MSNEQQASVFDDKKKTQTTLGFLFIILFIFFWIVFSFLSGFILALIGTIAGHKLLQAKPELKKSVPVIFVLLIVMTLGTIFLPAIQSDKEWRDDRDEVSSGTSQSYNYLTSTGTPERDIELATLKALGHDIQLTEITLNNSELQIVYVAKENLTKNLTRHGIFTNARDILKDVPQVAPNVNIITITPHLTLIDQYGKESLSRVATITFKKDTWRKINWENFLTDNLPNVADSYWLHPALSD